MSRVVIFDEFGGPEVLHVVDRPVDEPAAGEVRVRIEAFAVNPLDLMIRSGNAPFPVPPAPARLGVEGTGVIEALGPEVTGLKVGDPVIIAAIPDANEKGSYAEHTTVPASRVFPRPAGLSSTEAAAIWVAYSTAYGALIEKGGLRPGDQVLITAASGGVGRAAIQVANQIGAVPIAVTRDRAKKGELLAAGAAAVIATDHEEIVEAVLRQTGGTGADLVLDLVTGPGQPDLLKATRPGGTLLAAGFLDSRPTPVPQDGPVAVIGYQSFEHTLDPVAVKRMAAFLAAGVRLGALRPTIDKVFTIDEVAEAHRHLEKGLNAGKKIVVTV